MKNVSRNLNLDWNWNYGYNEGQDYFDDETFKKMMIILGLFILLILALGLDLLINY